MDLSMFAVALEATTEGTVNLTAEQDMAAQAVSLAVQDLQAYLQATQPRRSVVEHAATAAFWLGRRSGGGAKLLAALLGDGGQARAAPLIAAATARLRNEHREMLDNIFPPARRKLSRIEAAQAATGQWQWLFPAVA